MKVVIAEVSDGSRHLTYESPVGALIPAIGDTLIMESERHCTVVGRRFTYSPDPNQPVTQVDVLVDQP